MLTSGMELFLKEITENQMVLSAEGFTGVTGESLFGGFEIGVIEEPAETGNKCFDRDSR